VGQRRQDVLPSTTGKPIIRFNTQGYWRPLTQVCKHHAPLVSTWSFLQHCVVAQLWPEGQVWPPLPLGSWLGGGGGWTGEHGATGEGVVRVIASGGARAGGSGCEGSGRHTGILVMVADEDADGR